MNTELRLAKTIHASGINVARVTPWDYEEDGSIEITDRVHVQVGRNYVVVNCWVENGEAIRHWPTRRATQIAEIVKDIQSAIACDE